MSEIKLLPCPFCGNEMVYIVGTNVYWVHCCECGVDSPIFDSKKEAVKWWNTRKPMERIVDELLNLKKCYLGDEDAVMKPMSFADYIQEIIDKAGGIG